MALPEDNKSTTGKAQNTLSQKPDKREKPLTKVVIRRLPPTIDKETLLNQISPVPCYDYFYLVIGEAALGENSFSRAYINFVNSNDVYGFKEKFDNYIFLDNKGNEYAAVVEFAAFQKVSKKRNKVRTDPKCGTIESDPYYLEFLENLSKPIEQEDKPEYSYQFSCENKEGKDLVTTPLLEFVKNRRVERMRVREERREERRRKELERKKIREEERRKRFEEKSPTKVYPKPKSEDKDTSDIEVKDEKHESIENRSDKYFEKLSSNRNKDRKFEDRKKDAKIKTPLRKEYPEKREFKSRKEYFKESKFDLHKKEDRQFPKKVKKYSERREERKIEAEKAEMKKAEEQVKKSLNSSAVEVKEESKDDNVEGKSIKSLSVPTDSSEKLDSEDKNKKVEKIQQEKTDSKLENSVICSGKSDESVKTENDFSFSTESRNSDYKPGESNAKEYRRERIRNKDRPTIAIYRPGMLSKRKLTEGDSTDKDLCKEMPKETK